MFRLLNFTDGGGDDDDDDKEEDDSVTLSFQMFPFDPPEDYCFYC